MAQKAPGRSEREGITVMEAVRKFDSEEKAEQWFIDARWGGYIRCPRCDSDDIRWNVNAAMKKRFFCRPCGKFFSIKTGSSMENSKVPLSKWAMAVYLYSTDLKGVSSLKLHRDIGVTQKTAWYMAQRLRAGFKFDTNRKFNGPVEVDEVYIGGVGKWMHKDRKARLTGRGTVDKTAVAGMYDRATGMFRTEVVSNVDKETMHRFVTENTSEKAVVYTDDAKAYLGLGRKREHHTVKHGAGEYGPTNSVERFWSDMRRGIHGTYHNLSPKHLHRYAAEFEGRRNLRARDTEKQMKAVVQGMDGKPLPYKELVANTGESPHTTIKE